jgi:hypothetical protein
MRCVVTTIGRFEHATGLILNPITENRMVTSTKLHSNALALYYSNP